MRLDLFVVDAMRLPNNRKSQWVITTLIKFGLPFGPRGDIG